jgi:hypothetical protein
MYEPFIEDCLADFKIHHYLMKGVSNADASIKSLRVNISKDLTMDIIHMTEKIRKYMTEHRSRFLEVAFYI